VSAAVSGFVQHNLAPSQIHLRPHICFAAYLDMSCACKVASENLGAVEDGEDEDDEDDKDDKDDEDEEDDDDDGDDQDVDDGNEEGRAVLKYSPVAHVG